MNVAIHRRSAEENIEIPFPQREIRIRTAPAKPVKDTDASGRQPTGL